MIIQLDRSLASCIEMGNGMEARVSACLELLAIAQGEGNHIVFSDLETLKLLQEYRNSFSQKGAALLDRTLNRFPQTAKLARDVCVKLVVGNFDTVNSLNIDNVRIIQYPFSKLTSAVLQRTYLLVENIHDAKFYRWISENVLRIKNKSDSILAFEAYSGGGNTTADAYQYIKNDTERLCLCIVDSDIRWPGASVGETAAKVRSSDERDPKPNAAHYIIGVCSIENLIPLDVFYSAATSDANLKERVEQYANLYNDRCWPYLQLKKQITCFDLQKKNPFATFWADWLECHDDLRSCSDREKGQLCRNRDECREVKLPSLASKPLTIGMTFLCRQDTKYEAPLLATISEVWEKISLQVLGWCCGSTRSAAL